MFERPNDSNALKLFSKSTKLTTIEAFTLLKNKTQNAIQDFTGLLSAFCLLEYHVDSPWKTAPFNYESLKRDHSLSCAKGTIYYAVDFDFEKFEITLFEWHNDLSVLKLLLKST